MSEALIPEVVGGTVADQFGLSFKPKSPSDALARRLVDGTLKPSEQAQLARTREIRRRQANRETSPQIAAALKLTPQNLRAYMATNHYRLMCRWLTEQETRPTQVALRSRREEERAEWNALAPRALEFYRTAFDKHPPGTIVKGVDVGGRFVDPDRAERASKLIADGQGWTEPEPVVGKVQELKLGVIQAQMSAIAAVDRGETVIRVQVDVAHQQTREGDHPGEL